LIHEVKALQLVVGSLREEVNQKSNIKDVCALVDMKANTLDLERNVTDIFSAIQALKMSVKQTVTGNIGDQKYINEAFLSLNCLAKWVWHGGFTTSGSRGKHQS
jgi:hypothetical protein